MLKIEGPKYSFQPLRISLANAVSFIVGGVPSCSFTMTSGSISSGKPATLPMLVATRFMPSNNNWRSSGLSLRTVICSLAASEMMLCLVPLWNEPTVITRVVVEAGFDYHGLQSRNDL